MKFKLSFLGNKKAGSFGKTFWRKKEGYKKGVLITRNIEIFDRKRKNWLTWI